MKPKRRKKVCKKIYFSLTWYFNKKTETFDCLAKFKGYDFSDKGMDMYVHGCGMAKDKHMSDKEKISFASFCKGYLDKYTEKSR